MDCMVHGAAKSWTRPSEFHFQETMNYIRFGSQRDGKQKLTVSTHSESRESRTNKLEITVQHNWYHPREMQIHVHKGMKSESESCSVVSDSLQPHGLYSPWNFPGQNTGIGNLSLLQGIFPTQGSNPGLLHYGQILYQLSHKRSRCSDKPARCRQRVAPTCPSREIQHKQQRPSAAKDKQVKMKVVQLCLTLCNPRDHTVHGILQARILDWVAFPFSRGSSQLRD